MVVLEKYELLFFFWCNGAKALITSDHSFSVISQRFLFPGSIVVGCAPQMMPDFGANIVCPSMYYSAGRTRVIEENVPLCHPHTSETNFYFYLYWLFI